MVENLHKIERMLLRRVVSGKDGVQIGNEECEKDTVEDQHQQGHSDCEALRPIIEH